MSSVWWWLRSIQLFLTVALQLLLTPSRRRSFKYHEFQKLKLIDDESCDIKRLNQFSGNSDLKFLLKIWNCVGCVYMKFRGQFRHIKFHIRFTSSEMQEWTWGGSTVIFKMRSALRCRLRAWLLKIIFTIFSIKLNNKKTGILILIKPRLFGVVVTLKKTRKT